MNLEDVEEEDMGILAPCGILCLGCDSYLGESPKIAKSLLEIWEGFNIMDVAPVTGLNPKNLETTIKTLKMYVESSIRGTCPGCFVNQGHPSSFCGIAKCVKSKGYWTCAECDDFDRNSESPCPYIKENPMPMADKGQMSKLICARYNKNTIENLKRCQEIGYTEFIKEAKEKVEDGWRTWQVISDEMVFTKAMKK